MNRARIRCGWLLVFAICGLIATGQGATDRPGLKSYPCYQLSGPVVVDGQLDEPAWAALPEATGFFLLKVPRYSKERQATFHVGWDDQALYVGIRCAEPASEELAGLPAEKRGGWGGEIIEFFFLRERPQYRQFAVDVNGAVQFASAFVRNMFARKELPRDGVQAAGHVGPGAWTLEVRFAWSCFEAVPQVNDRWRFNLCRDSALGGKYGGERLLTWSFAETHFHDYDAYATLQFLGAAPGPAGVAKETARINAAYHAEVARRAVSDQRLAALQQALTVVTPLAWKTGPRDALDVNAGVPLWDDRRGHRYYGNLPVSFECYWAAPAAINTCRLAWCGAVPWSHYLPLVATDYGLEYWDGQAWQLAFHQAANDEVMPIETFPPVTTTRVRLTVFRATPDFETLRVRAFDLYQLPPITSPGGPR